MEGAPEARELVAYRMDVANLAAGIHFVRKSAGMCASPGCIAERHLAMSHALLERIIAPEEVTRARWAAEARPHLLIGKVVSREKGGAAGGDAKGAQNLASVRDALNNNQYR